MQRSVRYVRTVAALRAANASRAGAVTLHAADPNATLLQRSPRVQSPERSRLLRACLIGPTNAGKSTLLNSLLGKRVAIASEKIHTTRENTIGYLTDEGTATQIEFVDAPGSLGPDVPQLHREIYDALDRVHLALVVVDGRDERTQRQMGRFFRRLEKQLDDLEATTGSRPQTALVLNKVDKVKPRSKLLDVSRSLHEQFQFDWPPLMVSAKTGSGIAPMRGWLQLHAKPGEWRAPAHVVHNQSPLTRASEIIREQMFTFLRAELPYLVEQRNLGWTELSHPEGAIRIDQQFVLPARSKSARTILERRVPGIAAAARTALREEFGCLVFLHISIGTTGPNEMSSLAGHVIGIDRSGT